MKVTKHENSPSSESVGFGFVCPAADSLPLPIKPTPTAAPAPPPPTVPLPPNPNAPTVSATVVGERAYNGTESRGYLEVPPRLLTGELEVEMGG